MHSKAVKLLSEAARHALRRATTNKSHDAKQRALGAARAYLNAIEILNLMKEEYHERLVKR